LCKIDTEKIIPNVSFIICKLISLNDK
jgi:hypothetical protein